MKILILSLTLIFIGSKQASAFFWGDHSEPIISAIGERIFPSDAFQSPTLIFTQQNERFVNVDRAPSTTPPQPPIVDLVQAEPKPITRFARPSASFIGEPVPLARPQSQSQPRQVAPMSEPAIEVIIPVPGVEPTAYGPLPVNPSICPPAFLCCEGGAVFRNAFKLLACCGDFSYDSRFERCNDNIVVSVRPGMPKLTPAERLSRISCGGQSFYVPNALRCCNGTVYDATKYNCPVESLETYDAMPHMKSWEPPMPQKFSDDSFEPPESLPGPYGPQYVVCEIYRYRLSPRDLDSWGCCGAQLYNFKRENCTSGEIAPPRPQRRQKVVPQGELMIYCTGGMQHWINPAILPQIRCCGSKLCPIGNPSNDIDAGKRYRL